MSAEDLEKYETEMELKLYREYRDVVGLFKYVIETERRFYLCNSVDVKGPKGQMRQTLPPGVSAAVEDGRLVTKKETASDAFHGLARSLVNNAVVGVTDGFKKELDIVGVGYRAELKGKQVHFALGYSHPVIFDIPPGIDIAVDKQTHIVVTGVDRQLVGQVAANIRRMRKPDPYKQKGVRYTGEVLKKKVGKTGAK